MKILYLTEIFLPHISGYTIHVDRIAKHFSKTDKVLVATSSDKVLPKKEIIGNYKIVRLFSLSNPFNVNTNLSYLAALKINKIIQDFKPDIIHVHDPAFISFFGSKFAKQNNIPVVYTQHANSSFPSNFMPDIFKDLMASIYQKFISKFMNENCDIIISPSKYIKKDLLEIGVKTNIQIVSNGVDFNIFKPIKIEKNFIEKYNL
jgi:1,2-diacylglycerol 3-alpha-glucosyltransferase